jgi:hypothetical protein
LRSNFPQAQFCRAIFIEERGIPQKLNGLIYTRAARRYCEGLAIPQRAILGLKQERIGFLVTEFA